MKALLKISNLFILFLLCGIIFFPFLGEVNLFDWDETIVASISKEMFGKSELLQPWLNGSYYLDTPPLFFWMQLLSYKYLGINEYAARIPNAICAILVVLTLYKNGKRIYSTNFGMMWSIIYMSMLLPQLYHKSGLQDVWFNFFIYLSIYNMSRVIEARQERGEDFYKKRDVFSNLFYSAFAMTGAVMTKGIEGYIIVVTCYWLVFLFSSAKYGFGYVNIMKWTMYVILMLSVWVGLEYKWHGTDYILPFLQQQWADLNLAKASWTSRFVFPSIILFIGCFPASAICFNSFQMRSYESTIQKIFRLSMISCLLIVLIITSFLKVKSTHYTVLAYYPISFLAAYSLRYIMEERFPIRKLTLILIVIGGLIWTTCLTIVPLTRARLDFLKKYIHEDTLLDGLSKNYKWDMIELSIGIFFLVLFLTSIMLIILKKNKIALMLLFFSSMMTAEIVLIFYLPKIEQITQGPQVDFIRNTQGENAYYHYFGGQSYLSNFYSQDSSKLIHNFSLDSLSTYQIQKSHFYLIVKKADTGKLLPYQKNLQYLYPQGIYAFYKIKAIKTKK